MHNSSFITLSNHIFIMVMKERRIIDFKLLIKLIRTSKIKIFRQKHIIKLQEFLMVLLIGKTQKLFIPTRHGQSIVHLA